MSIALVSRRASRFLSFAVVALYIGFTPPAAAQEQQPARGETAWLDWCLEEGGSTFGCMVSYRTDLQRAQGAVLERMDRAFKGPDRLGTDYKAAAAQMEDTHKHWLAYMMSDCHVIDLVLADEMTFGLAGEHCVIKHYEARNANLLAFEEAYVVQEIMANLPVRP